MYTGGMAKIDPYYVPKRMMIKLTVAESVALRELSKREHRDPRRQAEYLIRERLVELGLIEVDNDNN